MIANDLIRACPVRVLARRLPTLALRFRISLSLGAARRARLPAAGADSFLRNSVADGWRAGGFVAQGSSPCAPTNKINSFRRFRKLGISGLTRLQTNYP
jgi:hypothetical protein